MKQRALEYLMSGFLYGMVFGAGLAFLFLLDPIWVAGFCLGYSLLGFLLVNFIASEIEDEPSCKVCGDKGIVIYAGSVDRDDGYCELRECSSCGDGKRLGRSDVPIFSDYNPHHPHLRRVK